MRCFVLFFLIVFSELSLAEEKTKSVYALNKEALGRAVKMYLAYEARNDVEPGVNADLDLPEKALFRHAQGGAVEEWVYPVALGLEIKIEQARVVMLAPRSCYGWYLVATDDLAVKAYRATQLQKVFDALEARRKKLAKSPLD